MSDAAINFQIIHDEFRSKIQRYLINLVGEFEAEDLTQEVFIKISRALPNFRGDSKLSTWIYRIATNTALDRLRDPKFERTIANELPDDSDAGVLEIEDKDLWTGEKAPSPEQHFFHKKDWSVIRILS